MDARLLDQLQRGCAAMELEVGPDQQELLLAYLELLLKWNSAYNLTAVREPAQMVTRHLLDSLAIAPHIGRQKEGRENIIDVGTGAGLPGIPMAILFPGTQFCLLDSNGKKTRFLFQVKTALGLDNMRVHQARVESFQPPELFDAVLSRAFASLADMVAGCKHLLAPGGRFLAMKGAYPAQELALLESAYAVSDVRTLVIPGLDERRHLVEMIMLDNGETR